MEITANETNTIVCCPICDSPKKSLLKKNTKDYLAKCISCAFVYSTRKPTKSELDAVYNNYDYGNTPVNSTAVLKRRSIARILNTHKNIKLVLDVGCGSGEWLDIFRENGCQTFGTEYN